MKWFKNRTTGAKLMIAFVLMAALAAVVGYQGIQGMNAIDDHLKAIHETHAIGLMHLEEAQVAFIKSTRAVRTGMIDAMNKDAKGVEKRADELRRYQSAFAKEFPEFQKRIVSADTRAAAVEAESAMRELFTKQDHVMELARADKVSEANSGLAEVREMATGMEGRIEKLVQRKLQAMNEAAAAADDAFRSTRAFVIGVILIAIIVAVGVGMFIARLIAKPLVATVDVLQAVAKGDFTQRLDVDTEDEVGQMADALNQAVDGMRGALQEVALAADHAASAAQQLSASSEQLASGAQEQASSIEETAASLEEITGTVKQNADNARQANQLASGARDAADKGGEVVTTAVGAMTEINHSSKKIADIITTIDEIAFQTNLLALNAAVEAARAGEQGRGFAVVAAEVRNLAQRAATAAKEIKSLIQDSVGKVEAGSELVNRSGQTLGEIVTSVKRVTDIIAEIAAASQEQSSGIDQVNKAVTQMDQVVQANSAQTEELSSTAQALAAQAEQLQGLVARFKLGAARTAPSAPRVAPVHRAVGAPRVVAHPHPTAARPTKTSPKLELVAAGSHSAVTNGSSHGDHDGFDEF